MPATSHHWIVLMETCNNRNADKEQKEEEEWMNEKKKKKRLNNFFYSPENRELGWWFFLMNFSLAIFTNSRANAVPCRTVCVCMCIYDSQCTSHMLQYSYAIYIHCSIPFRTSRVVFSQFIVGLVVFWTNTHIYHFRHFQLHRTIGPSNNNI